MRPTEPLPLYHSWPLIDADCRFDLGRVDDPWDERDAPPGAGASPIVRGTWSCALADQRLSWSCETHRLFGFSPLSGAPDRRAAVALYAEPSRAAMERLRAHAIRHRRGFTLDVEIFPIGGPTRWLRLIAAPAVEQGRVVRLHGCKADVTHLYRH